MTDYSSLKLHDVVMHQIVINPDREESKFLTQLTDEPVVLSVADRTFLKDRFVRALKKSGMPVIEEHSVDSPVPAYLRDLWAERGDFMEVSKQLASYLAGCQTLSAAAGLLVVAKATLTDDEAFLIAKVEHQEAMRIEPYTNEEGHRVIEVQHLKELVFGEAARIYKVALLSKSASSSGGVAGDLADDQNVAGIAAYYLNKFMGMKLRDEPSVLTERYLKTMDTVINQTTLPSVKKADVQAALLADLRSNNTQVDVQDFIRNHVPQGYQPEIARLVTERGVPKSQFRKENQLIRTRLERLRLNLSNDVRISAPSDQIGEGRAVELKDIVDPQTGEKSVQIVVRGATLDSIRANGGGN